MVNKVDRRLITDPFDVPRELVPAGVSYQWCAKEQFGKIDKNYQKMIEAGWRAVPFKRHAEFFSASYGSPSGDIQYGGCVLMERQHQQVDLARERELDSACLQAGNGRTVSVQMALHIRLNHSELTTAIMLEMTGSQYANKRIQQLADGSLGYDSVLRGREGGLYFDILLPPVVRRPKYPWLSWLFNLISVENKS